MTINAVQDDICVICQYIPSGKTVDLHSQKKVVHRFCLECLQNYVNSRPHVQAGHPCERCYVLCPICRQADPLPKGIVPPHIIGRRPTENFHNELFRNVWEAINRHLPSSFPLNRVE